MVNHEGKSNSLPSDTDSNGSVRKMFMNNIFANTDNEGKIYPVTVSEIASNQHLDKPLKTLSEKEDLKGRITCKVIDNVDVLVYDDKCMCITGFMTDQVVQ